MIDLRQLAREVFLVESAAVAALADRVDDRFDEAVRAILDCEGRVIVAGMGKSGLIGKKIAATFNSTGIASFFLHPAEAMHGDVGLMCAEDLLLLISKSCRLGEMEMIVSSARRLGVRIIVLGGTPGAELAERADVFLDCSVEREACPNNMVPTSSATAALVMGDALAMALLAARDFSPSDFAALHPAGFLGTRLLKRVSELHHTGSSIPIIVADTPMKEVILEMTSKRLGCVLLLDDTRRPVGIFTDGDLRRLIEKRDDFYELTAAEIMRTAPKTIEQDSIIDAALALMEKHSITQLITVDEEGQLAGIIHLHDILRSKLV